MHPKPDPHQFAQARRRAAHRKARAQCRMSVWARDHGRCVVCHEALGLDEAHIHEVRYRSLGGSDTDPANCVVLCRCCHEAVHRKLVKVERAPDNQSLQGGCEDVEAN